MLNEAKRKTQTFSPFLVVVRWKKNQSSVERRTWVEREAKREGGREEREGRERRRGRWKANYLGEQDELKMRVMKGKGERERAGSGA